MTAYEQRSYPGAAADTLLNADITNSATSFSVTPGSGTGYPDGSQGPFFVIIDWDTSKAEKIRCSGRVNDTFTVAGTGGGRGQDGTSAQAHTANAKVRAVITATDVQEANRAASQTIGKVTTKGDLLAGTGANALTRVAAGTNGTFVVADAAQAAGIRYSTITETQLGTLFPVATYVQPAWYDTSGQPTLFTGTGSSRTGFYSRSGIFIVGMAQVTCASSGAFTPGSISFDLPVVSTPNALSQICGTWHIDGTTTGGFLYVGHSSSICMLKTTAFADVAITPAAGQEIVANFNYAAT